MSGAAAASSARGRGEHRLGPVGRLAQRVRSGGPLEVGEPQPQHHRPAHPLGLAQPPGHAVHERHQCRVHRLRRARAPARAHAAPRSSAAAGAAPPAAGRARWPARAGAARRPRPSSSISASSRTSATSPTRVQPRVVQLLGGDRRRRPTAAPPAADAGTRARRPAAPPAARPASPPRSPPSPGTSSAPRPTLIGSPTSSRTRAPQPRSDLLGRAGEVLHAAHVEERLVDRQRLHRRAPCPRRSRRRPCSPPSTPRTGTGTTAASGHRNRARPPPIPLSTPRAFAS